MTHEKPKFCRGESYQNSSRCYRIHELRTVALGRRINILNWLSSQEINTSTALTRQMFSLVAGGFIGFERESRRQPTGLRTHILIPVGSILLMMLSIFLPQIIFDVKNGDTGRIAAQVVSGIGFLGAVAIIKLNSTIKGLTTAASIWVVAGLGLSIGAGLYVPSLIALLIILFTLIVIDFSEKQLFPPERVKTIRRYFNGTSVDIKKIQKTFGD